jgi:hypothetical protein
MKMSTALFAVVFLWTVSVQSQELDKEALKKKVDQAYAKDMALLQEISFKRRVVRQSLKSDRSVKSQQTLYSQITPKGDEFDELLLETNGRTATSKEVKKHRKSGTFKKHYDELKIGRVNVDLIADLTLSLLIDTYQFEYEGDEEIQGVLCHRLAVKSFNPPKDATDTEVIASASEGVFLIDAESGSIVRISIELVRPLKTMGAGLNALKLKVDTTRWNGHWLANRIEVESEYKLLVTIRKRNIWTYSDIKELPKEH